MKMHETLRWLRRDSDDEFDPSDFADGLNPDDGTFDPGDYADPDDEYPDDGADDIDRAWVCSTCDPPESCPYAAGNDLQYPA